MLEFRPVSTGMINTSQKLTGAMFQGVDIVGGTAAAVITIYDSGANTGNVLFTGSNSTARETIELSYPVAGVGPLWVEIAGTQANCVVRYK